MGEIDPMSYGELRAHVAQMRQDMAEMRADVRELMALVNQGRGGLWVGRLFAGTVGGIAAFLADHILRR